MLEAQTRIFSLRTSRLIDLNPHPPPEPPDRVPPSQSGSSTIYLRSPSIAAPPLLTHLELAFRVPEIPLLQRHRSTHRETEQPPSPPFVDLHQPDLRLVYSLVLLAKNFHRLIFIRPLGIGFQILIMGLRFSLGSNESYGSRYGNVGALVLSLASAPTPPLNIAKSLSSPPTGSELCSASINLTQWCSFCSIPATPVSSMRFFKRSENIEPGIPAYVVSARCHCSTLSPHPQQTNHSKLNSATHGPPGIYALMLSLIQLDEMCFCLVSVALWLQHGNVERWSQCVNSKTGCPSSQFGFLSQAKEIKSPWPVLASNTLMESAIASTAPLSSPPTNLLSGMFEIHIVSRVNSTLIRAISNNSQSKEIIGIVSDIRSIFSGFATIVFSHIFRFENLIAYIIAKQALHAFSSLY